MFGRFKHKALTLDLEDRTVTFERVGDFEFALASRTEVPAAKVAELVRFDPEALEREATSIREVEKRFVEILSKAQEGSASIGHLLRELDPKLFSQDHEWRDIMRSLVDHGPQLEDFKRMAVVKYLQYLGSRQDILRSIYANKHPAPARAPAADASGPDLKETVIFDVSESGPAQRTSTRFRRLPRGETVQIAVAPGAELDLILSRHCFRLATDGTARLTDEAGNEYRLGPGRNVLGRQPGNDVIIDNAMRDVSRKHVVVEVLGAGRVRLTDFSSHGTFVPRDVEEEQSGYT